MSGILFRLATFAAGMSAAAVAIAQFNPMGSTADSYVEKGRSLDPDPNMTRIRAPGDYRFKFVRDRVDRRYYVYVPKKSYGQPMPLLIALHEEEGEGEFAGDVDLTRKSDKKGFIVVAPYGYPLFTDGGGRTWNAGRCCGPAQNHNADDIGYLREVIRRVEQQTSVDASRIFVTGYSNGAMMAWRLACEVPEVRAIAPVAGTDNTLNCRPSHPVAVIQFHALDDRYVPFNGGKGRRSISGIDFASVPASQEKWIGINNADPIATRVLTVRGGYCDRHLARTGGAPVELCVTEKGRHDWPSKPKPIDAYDLMWDFFSSL